MVTAPAPPVAAHVKGCELAGYRAGLRGVSRFGCPYTAVWAVRAWLRGWGQAGVALAANLRLEELP